jgi:hypothetical protein
METIVLRFEREGGMLTAAQCLLDLTVSWNVEIPTNVCFSG